MKRNIEVVDEAWAKQLNADSLEAVVSLGMYSRRATLLFDHTDKAMQAVTDPEKSKEEQQKIFWKEFIPYYTVWVSLIFVLWDALKHLKIDDPAIKEIVKDLDVDLLRRYRNSTLHFDPKFRSDDESAFLARNGFIAVRKLFERQEELVFQMLDLIKENPHYGISAVKV